MKYLLICIFSLSTLLSFGKDDTSRFCNPKLEGMQRSKGFNISYERVFATTLRSTSSDPSIGNSTSKVRTNNKFDVLARFPVWNSPGLKIVLGVRYYFEEFNFVQPENLTYDLYKNLNDKNLKSLGSNVNVLKPLNKISYIGARFLAELNGDYNSDNLTKSSFLRYSFAFLYGRKTCPTRSWALGVYYSYTFGRRSIYPVFVYNNTFNKKWGLEATLPANLKIRRNFSEKTLLYFGYEVEGGSYHLEFNNPPLQAVNDLELRRSNVRFGFDFEREIHDWLWFGISSGFRIPLGFNLARHLERDPIVENDLSTAPYINFNIFIVPPRTLENKILNTR